MGKWNRHISFDDDEVGPKIRKRFGDILRKVIEAAALGNIYGPKRMKRRDGYPVGKSGYIGVRPNPRGDGWVAVVNYKGKQTYVTSSKDARKAAIAYDEKARELLGDKARLNFYESPEPHRGAYQISQEMGGVYSTYTIAAIMDGEWAQSNYIEVMRRILEVIEQLSSMSEDDICMRVKDADLLYDFCRGY